MCIYNAEPPCPNTFIGLETLATYITRTPCCSASYYLHIIPEMTFTCNGNITGWTAGAYWSETSSPQIVSELQVWRNELDLGNTFTRVASAQLIPIPPANTNHHYPDHRRIFSNKFDSPISVKRGDVLGLILSPGQMVMHLTSFTDVPLPKNYIYTSSSNFNMVHVDLDRPEWTSIEPLRPLISLDISKSDVYYQHYVPCI